MGIFRRLFSRQKGQFHHLLVVVNLLEILILLHDTLVVLVFHPEATALIQLLIELGIELFIRNRPGIIYLIGKDADEAAGPSCVNQWTQVVGGGNE